MRRLLSLLALALALPATAPAAVEPHGINDGGGFRNVLPPGQAGTAKFQFGAFTAGGERPEHWDDQNRPTFQQTVSVERKIPR